MTIYELMDKNPTKWNLPNLSSKERDNQIQTSLYLWNKLYSLFKISHKRTHAQVFSAECLRSLTKSKRNNDNNLTKCFFLESNRNGILTTTFIEILVILLSKPNQYIIKMSNKIVNMLSFKIAGVCVCVCEIASYL